MAVDMLGLVLFMSFCGIAGFFMIVCACFCCWLENKTKYKAGENVSFTEKSIRRTFIEKGENLKNIGLKRNNKLPMKIKEKKIANQSSKSVSIESLTVEKSKITL